MKDQLSEISRTSIVLRDFDFPETLVQKNWLGQEPATDEQIIEAEKRLGVSLPTDYKTFLKLCNGFHAPNDVEPTFLSIEKIDFLMKLDPDLVTVWMETPEIGNELKGSILIAGEFEEQHFLLLPPNGKLGWRYWKFASWMLGQQEYNDLLSYWTDVLEFNREQIQKK